MMPSQLQSITEASKLLETKDLQDRLKKIKLLILDVDGVLTDGRIFWLESQGWTRYFNVKDGYGLVLLRKSGVQIAVISGGDSKDVRFRMKFLKIQHVFLGDEAKLKALDKIQKTTGFDYEAMAFIGDDLYDIPIIEKVGFSATVPHAVPEVKNKVHYITENHGGWGAVREVADAIRAARANEH
ncbi:MAG: HAD hydrolase family protein [Deltaproteobacteria bacterium]|nr:HAD hydrolase family protein [Deltaproteobacteria bacterium]